MSQPPPVFHKTSPEEAESVATSPEQRAASAEVTPECGSHNQSCSKEVAGRMPNNRAWLLTAPKEQMCVLREGCSQKCHSASVVYRVLYVEKGGQSRDVARG